jgi:hypothetical protein
MHTTLYWRTAVAGLLGLPVALACRAAPGTVSGEVGPADLRADVAWLSADAREGRATGSPGFEAAAGFVTRRYRELGILPAPGMTDYLQRYHARSARTRGAEPTTVAASNVVAFIPGRDPALADEVIVLGAHLDHLGRSTVGALDPGAGNAIRNGADDNASGSAVVLELARRLRAAPTRRSILLVHFSGEELGLLGSTHFVEHSPVPLERVQAMLYFDMVGRLNNDRLIIYGVGTAAELPGLIDSVSVGTGFVVNQVPDGIGPSDHAAFHTRDVPVLHFFTDIHADYHRASDDVERINANGMWRVAGLAEQLTRALGDRPGKLAVQRTAAASTTTGSRQSSGVYLGSIPDMGAADVVGMRISGVRADSPAERGGLRGGDVVVEFGGRPVKDIYEYTDALNAFSPGDTVTVIVVRDGARVTLRITLGRRDG